jgi:hypothetical protein
LPLSPTRRRALLRAATLRRTRPDTALHLLWGWLLPRALLGAVSALLALPAALAALIPAAAPRSPPPPELRPAESEGLVVLVSRKHVFLGEDPISVLDLPPREELVRHGAPASAKQHGENDLFLVPLAAALDRAREDARARGRALPEEAIIVADESTPYRLLIEVLFTLGQREMGKFHFMLRAGKPAR